MSKHKYGVQLKTKNNTSPVIYFDDLHDRKLFLNLLNKSRMNSSIILFEEKKKEEK